MLTAVGDFEQPEPTYPNGSHVAEVEIDPDTGVTEIVGYWIVDDFGATVNPIAARRPGAWRHRAGDRPGALREHRL